MKRGVLALYRELRERDLTDLREAFRLDAAAAHSRKTKDFCRYRIRLINQVLREKAK